MLVILKNFIQKKMLILTLIFKLSPLTDCIWNSTDITKIYLQLLPFNKGIWIFTFLSYCTKAANVSAVAPAAGKFSTICEEVVEQLGNARCF